MDANQLAEALARAVEAAKPAQEYCFLWFVTNWWPMCMTKAEWSGWMQAIFSVAAIVIAFFAPRIQDYFQQRKLISELRLHLPRVRRVLGNIRDAHNNLVGRLSACEDYGAGKIVVEAFAKTMEYNDGPDSDTLKMIEKADLENGLGFLFVESLRKYRTGSVALSLVFKVPNDGKQILMGNLSMGVDLASVGMGGVLADVEEKLSLLEIYCESNRKRRLFFFRK